MFVAKCNLPYINQFMNKKLSESNIKLILFSIFISLVAYGFGLTNYSLSIDSESPVYSDFSMGLGRWGTNLVRYHIFKGHTPYFTLLLGLLLLSMTAVELSKLFKFNDAKGYIFCGLFLTIPQLSYQLIFTMQADVVPLGFLLSIFAVRLFLKSTISVFSLRSISYFAISSLLLMFVIAIYQALILIPIVAYLIVVFQNSYSKDFNIKKEIINMVHFGILLLLSAILYYISVKIICPTGEGGFLATYTTGESNNKFLDFFTLWFEHLKGKVYYGNKLFLFVTILSIFGIVNFILEKKYFIIKLILLLLILIIPYSLSFFITNGYHPPRLYVASGIVFAFLITHFLANIRYQKTTILACAIICMCNIYFITQLFYSNYKIFNHDKDVARKIDSAIRLKYPEFDNYTNYVYFFGCIPYQEHEKFRLPDSEVFGGSLFSWDNGNNYRIINFFSFNDIAYYKMIDNKDTYLKIKDSISNMPTWPKQESIKLIDNVIIVKLGDAKGAPLPIE